MGKKKTQLKPETKALLDQHIDAASKITHSAPVPSSQLFSIDKAPSAATKNKAKQAAVAGVKRKHSGDDDDMADEDAMDTTAEAGAYFHDSDDEEVGIVVRNGSQRRAHLQKPNKLVSERETKRLKSATETKSKKEADVAAANPAVFDIWATSLEADLKKGIVPAANEKGFRVGRTQQTRFRHRGVDRNKEHVHGSTLSKQIHEGASFHPDYDAHQSLLRVAFDKDQTEKAEIAAIRARFTAQHAKPADDSAAAPAVEDDSWMDEPANGDSKKNAPTSHVKFSKTERNRMARAEANRQKVAAQIEEKELGKLVNRIPVIVSELKKEEKQRAKEKARVEHLKKVNPDHKPKLGRYAEEELFPEVQLTEELPEDGSLRALKPSSNVMNEQFARFQSRHLIETRKKVKTTRTIKGRSYERYKDYEQEQTQNRLDAEKEAEKAARLEAKQNKKKQQ